MIEFSRINIESIERRMLSGDVKSTFLDQAAILSGLEETNIHDLLEDSIFLSIMEFTSTLELALSLGLVSASDVSKSHSDIIESSTFKYLVNSYPHQGLNKRFLSRFTDRADFDTIKFENPDSLLSFLMSLKRYVSSSRSVSNFISLVKEDHKYTSMGEYNTLVRIVSDPEQFVTSVFRDTTAEPGLALGFIRYIEFCRGLSMVFETNDFYLKDILSMYFENYISDIDIDRLKQLVKITTSWSKQIASFDFKISGSKSRRISSDEIRPYVEASRQSIVRLDIMLDMLMGLGAIS